MTADEFRKIALSLPESVEFAHMRHPDFRVRNKIFATLGYPDGDHAMVKLTPVDQQLFIKADPVTFAKSKGAWGDKGATIVRLGSARTGLLRDALIAAWSTTASKAKRGRR